MHLMPEFDDDNNLTGYTLTDNEKEAVFAILYTADHWFEKDENEVYHEYTDFSIKQMEILGFTGVFQFVRVATGLESYLQPYIKAHFYNAWIDGKLET